MSGVPGPLVFFRYQVSVMESTTPMVVTPSPFQSPATGTHPGAPYANGAMSGAPGVVLVCRYHVPVVGSNTPGPCGEASAGGAAAGGGGDSVAGGVDSWLTIQLNLLAVIRVAMPCVSVNSETTPTTKRSPALS